MIWKMLGRRPFEDFWRDALSALPRPALPDLDDPADVARWQQNHDDFMRMAVLRAIGPHERQERVWRIVERVAMYAAVVLAWILLWRLS